MGQLLRLLLVLWCGVALTTGDALALGDEPDDPIPPVSDPCDAGGPVANIAGGNAGGNGSSCDDDDDEETCDGVWQDMLAQYNPNEELGPSPLADQLSGVMESMMNVVTMYENGQASYETAAYNINERRAEVIGNEITDMDEILSNARDSFHERIMNSCDGDAEDIALDVLAHLNATLENLANTYFDDAMADLNMLASQMCDGPFADECASEGPEAPGGEAQGNSAVMDAGQAIGACDENGVCVPN